MTTLAPVEIQAGHEPIKGYVLEELIGRGGFGEVWRADAPGGLKKAVKFVFGHQKGSRATQELKSLERIKSIQHPFILTLERFEFINNQLVIVTELADGSLEDIYTNHRERGSCGIPREELLSYLKDTADALDYLHNLNKLQHLDIKPANLLLVGGRVKVGDFGLLKDLGDVECSLVGGLTPIYAAPEVFDGRPSMHSDQYSLAVMYQELLTSTRPFSGRTIAQLATQHVHNAPNLEPLPAADRPCVARALEKSPERRFTNCSEFVDKLANPRGRAASLTAEEGSTEKPLKRMHLVENLPQVRANGDGETKQMHALVVGLGGTGADCLHQVRSRVSELGAASPLTLHSVLIDSDPLSTQTASMIEPSEFTPQCRVVRATLRSAKDYRESGTERLRTVSRRWIYNVPRNASTGGMRPLGRMALVDHGEKVMQTLTTTIEQLKASCGADADVKIYVVGSLAGGTGSGIFIDVVYLLRHLLDELGMEQEQILSLLTTNPFRGDPALPLSLHSMKAALSELGHFMRPGNGYPGDPGAGFPSVPAARTPLHDAYIVAASEETGAGTPIDAVANYLWCDATYCRNWFASARREDSERDAEPRIRSFGAVSLIDPDEHHSSLLAPHTAKSLLLQWLGGPRGLEESAKEFRDRLVRRCSLDFKTQLEKALTCFGKTFEERSTRIQEEVSTLDANQLHRPSAIQRHLAAWLMGQADTEQMELVAEQIKQQVSRETKLRLQDRRSDLSTSMGGLSFLAAHVEDLAADMKRQGEESLTEFEKEQRETSTPPSLVPSEAIEQAAAIGSRLQSIVAHQIAATVLKSLAKSLLDIVEVYADASTRIAQAVQRLDQGSAWTQDPWQTIEQPLRERLPSILERLHRRTVIECLFNLVDNPDGVETEHLISELSTNAAVAIRDGFEESSDAMHAAKATLAQLKHSSKTELFEHSTPTTELGTRANLTTSLEESGGMSQTRSWSSKQKAPPVTVEAALQAVRPPLLDCGGKQRVYLICRDQAELAQMEAQLPKDCEFSITKVVDRSAAPMLVHEAQQIELKNVIEWLETLTGDDGRISARLSTRTDVDWS
ncbi:MAG: tubulin-like doman-containing protein [Planctomycetota bacterium]